MYYIDRTTKQYPLTRHEVLPRNFEIGLKAIWGPAELEALNVYPVYPTTTDLVPALNQQLVESTPELNVEENKYYQTWTLVELTTAEIDEKIKQRWAVVRKQRNDAIAQADAMVLPDVWERYNTEQKRIWTEYRQALRDIPTDNADPFNINWPEHPVIKPGSLNQPPQ